MHRGMSTLRESSPELDDSEDDGVLERAIRTRLPRGSQSPGKGRSMSPEKTDDPTIQFQLHEKTSALPSVPKFSIALNLLKQPSTSFVITTKLLLGHGQQLSPPSSLPSSLSLSSSLSYSPLPHVQLAIL
ncbi:hypothetical protein LB505_006310 [Fusarium chuoi]|nr:hypothetical protein LB505_006310 [Fusarium chuoi]